MRRARQASRSPACTRAQCRGSRYFSSTAAATSARPPSVERPMARANSAMQNSATSGAPSPASVRPVSPPGVIQVAASSMDSGGCCSAQVTAAIIRSACARLAAAWLSRANTSTSRAESRSPRSVLVVAVMSEFKHRALTETGEISLLWKGILDFLSTPVGGPGWLLGVRRLVPSVRSLRVSSVHSLRSLLDHHSLLDHLWLRPARVSWFRDARFARSSTTGIRARCSTTVWSRARASRVSVVSRRSLALAPQPP